ncbi:hypothetical protein EVAR_15851_1 [Eumeta japonica]|uniref:Uncharacterized protein n=1 Tax=Eumeta variegata TaxID=151549 RepID=A0A4C1UDY1_EUMVA|nr:hypothetical protein EVAR_15851_1 [Eumeta japonica]
MPVERQFAGYRYKNVEIQKLKTNTISPRCPREPIHHSVIIGGYYRRAAGAARPPTRVPFQWPDRRSNSAPMQSTVNTLIRLPLLMLG